MNNKKFPFTLNEYEHIIQTLIKRNYSFGNFERVPSSDNYILLRHDVDFSIHAAYRLAKIEFKYNIAGTYFIQLSSAFYNALTPNFSEIIRDIHNMGHFIGLHFDPKTYDNDDNLDIDKIIQCLKAEVNVLSSIISSEIKVVSFHNPSKNVLNKDLASYGIISTYSPKFFNNPQITYVADSNMKWRDGYILDVANGHHSIQLLIHPAHWNALEHGVLYERTMTTPLQLQLENAYNTMSTENYFWQNHTQDYLQEHSLPITYTIQH